MPTDENFPAYLKLFFFGNFKQLVLYEVKKLVWDPHRLAFSIICSFLLMKRQSFEKFHLKKNYLKAIFTTNSKEDE